MMLLIFFKQTLDKNSWKWCYS